MSKINVLFAITAATELLIRQNFQYDVDGNRLRTDLTKSQAKKLKTNISGFWNVPNIAGTDYTIASWYVPDIVVDSETGLTWVEFLLDKWPGKFIIIGAWNSDGSMYGTNIIPPTYDDEGVELTPESIEGTPVYPIHAQYLKIFPDVNELPATEPAEVNKLLGWKDRRWA